MANWLLGFPRQDSLTIALMNKPFDQLANDELTASVSPDIHLEEYEAEIIN
jgi:hypothetical protein